MGLHLVEIYRSPNVGIFLRTNDKFLLAPKGIASTKSQMLAEDLKVTPCFVSVEGTRLLGPLVIMNNKGIIVSRMCASRRTSGRDQQRSSGLSEAHGGAGARGGRGLRGGGVSRVDKRRNSLSFFRPGGKFRQCGGREPHHWTRIDLSHQGPQGIDSPLVLKKGHNGLRTYSP
jgi:hypothetical protein